VRRDKKCAVLRPLSLSAAVAVYGNDIIKLQHGHSVNRCDVQVNRGICVSPTAIFDLLNMADALVGLICSRVSERIDNANDVIVVITINNTRSVYIF